jgi:hypothetical protein
MYIGEEEKGLIHRQKNVTEEEEVFSLLFSYCKIEEEKNDIRLEG